MQHSVGCDLLLYCLQNMFYGMLGINGSRGTNIILREATVEIVCLPPEKGSTLKGKNLLTQSVFQIYQGQQTQEMEQTK